ncbi:MAG: hypothetical protein Q4F54_02175 [Coriobacteriia bacterium]|nr:hypothetical protein [Coriobacteriia bacterium]
MLYIVDLCNSESLSEKNLSFQICSKNRILSPQIPEYVKVFSTDKRNQQIQYVNLENLYFNTPINNIKEVSQMFKDYQMLEKIEFGNNREGIFEGVQVFDEMFVNCGNLKNIDVASWFKDNEKHEFNIVSATGMFNDCSNLQRIYCKYKET